MLLIKKLLLPSAGRMEPVESCTVTLMLRRVLAEVLVMVRLSGNWLFAMTALSLPKL